MGISVTSNLSTLTGNLGSLSAQISLPDLVGLPANFSTILNEQLASVSLETPSISVLRNAPLRQLFDERQAPTATNTLPPHLDTLTSTSLLPTTALTQGTTAQPAAPNDGIIPKASTATDSGVAKIPLLAAEQSKFVPAALLSTRAENKVASKPSDDEKIEKSEDKRLGPGTAELLPTQLAVTVAPLAASRLKQESPERREPSIQQELSVNVFGLSIFQGNPSPPAKITADLSGNTNTAPATATAPLSSVMQYSTSNAGFESGLFGAQTSTATSARALSDREGKFPETQQIANSPVTGKLELPVNPGLPPQIQSASFPSGAAEPAILAAENSGTLQTPVTIASQMFAASATPASMAPASLPPLAVSTPVNDSRWPQEFGDRVIWMTKNEQQSAQISITPAHLGPIQISINLNGDQATAIFASPHAEVRQAIQDALPQLREMLSSAGISLGQSNVGTQLPQQQRDTSPQFANGNRGGGETDILSPDSHVSSISTGLVIQRGRGMVDLFA